MTDPIKAKIIELVPEIVELKEGCLLDTHYGESYGLITVHQMTSVCKKHKKYRDECGAEENGCTNYEAIFGTSGYDEGWWTHTIKIEDIKPYQIIGRPITLADVLRAISEITIYVADGGEFFQFISFDSEGSHVLKDLGISWNLTTDYDGQTQEVKDFIGKLLRV